jgi:signal transduction histidine kinase
MAKSFVQISLATKLRLLFGMAVLGIIAAALLVPWYFMELVAEQGVQRPAAELTRLRLNEWIQTHPTDSDAESVVARLYAAESPGAVRSGPSFRRVRADLTTPEPLDTLSRDALTAFVANPSQELVILKDRDGGDRSFFRCYRAVRVEPRCLSCHGPSAPVARQFQVGQIAGMIEVAIPPETAGGEPLIGMTRVVFAVGGLLGAIFAMIAFAILVQRLILRPIRSLRSVADKATEGNLSVRSTITTGDELQRLGESFNEMLSAISKQHGQLRSVNRALDLKLHELAEANVALFQANKVKSEFLANVSHELRTPLNSILGFAELIAESDNERLQRYGRNIGTAATNLLRMINDILDLAKIEAGRAEVCLERVSVSDTCQTLLALMGPIAAKEQIQLDSSIEEDLPLITSDPGKVQQILYNLLSNAVKFTPAGGTVTLEAVGETGEEADNGGEVRVSVSDTGPGIAEADQQHIFEKFYQIDRSLTKQTSGTGLGLAISRELANLLGGRLSLNSTPGAGATFTLSLPVEPPEDVRGAAEPPEEADEDPSAGGSDEQQA